MDIPGNKGADFKVAQTMEVEGVKKKGSYVEFKDEDDIVNNKVKKINKIQFI